jgi:agmatinase
VARREADALRPVSTRRVPRFAGVPTFLRLPVRESPHGVDVLVCGAPFDGGTTFRPGARFGPRAVRQASALTRGFHPDHGVDLFDHLRCADGGDVPMVPMSVERALEALEARADAIVAAGAVPAFVGGDHTISLAPLRALARRFGPLGLVHVDAHSDTFGPAWGVDLHHGTVFRHAVQEGLLRAGDVLQIGVRGPFTAKEDLDFARRAGFRVVGVDEVRRDLDAVAGAIAGLRGRGPVYLSFDMDGLDPAYAPGTGTPVPGGLTSWEALRLLRALRGVELVGLDIVEISPDHDLGGATALLAATLLAEALAALAATRADAAAATAKPGARARWQAGAVSGRRGRRGDGGSRA